MGTKEGCINGKGSPLPKLPPGYATDMLVIVQTSWNLFC